MKGTSRVDLQNLFREVVSEDPVVTSRPDHLQNAVLDERHVAVRATVFPQQNSLSDLLTCHQDCSVSVSGVVRGSRFGNTHRLIQSYKADNFQLMNTLFMVHTINTSSPLKLTNLDIHTYVSEKFSKSVLALRMVSVISFLSSYVLQEPRTPSSLFIGLHNTKNQRKSGHFTQQPTSEPFLLPVRERVFVFRQIQPVQDL